MVSVSIIGPGRVGGALAVSLPPDRYNVERLIFKGENDLSPILSLFDRKPALVRYDELTEIGSDVIFITTQDAWIVPVAREIASKIQGRPVVFHTSGSYA